MRGEKKKLREDLFVVWEDDSRRPGSLRRWAVSLVVNHNASRDPSAAKRVTYDELVVSLICRVDAVFAPSKEEALLRHAASGKRGPVWSIEGGEAVCVQCPAGRSYRLVKEDF